MSQKFPHPVYERTVLVPLFEGVKAHFAGHLAAINRAHLVMLVETRILNRLRGGAIARALQQIDRDVDPATLSYDNRHEDYFFLVEAQLEARLGADLGGMLHTARSRNDIDHTLFKMALRTRTDALTAKALALAGALLETARRERSTLILAYTHGQPAQPTTYGHYIAAALEVLLGDIARLAAARAALDQCPMGAAAITTSGFPIDRQRVADLLGFERPRLNSYGCIAAVDYVTGLYSALGLIFLHLGRLVQDLQFWSAFEVGQLRVPDSLVQISSIMPQKRNPVSIEHLRHLASMTLGHCNAILQTMHNTPFTDMNDSEGEVQQAGFAAFESGGRMLDLLTALVPACSIDQARVRARLDASCATITELADTLVRTDGLSFRQAHEIAARTAATVIEAEPLAQGYVAFEDAYRNLVGRPPQLNQATFERAVSADTFIAVRDRPGGPAPAALDAAFEVYQSEVQDLLSGLSRVVERIAAAERALATAFKALTEE